MFHMREPFKKVRLRITRRGEQSALVHGEKASHSLSLTSEERTADYQLHTSQTFSSVTVDVIRALISATK